MQLATSRSIVVFLMALLVGTPLALAQRGGGRNNNNNGYNAPPPIDRSASIAAQREVNAARSDLTRAGNAKAAVVNRLRLQYELTPEWVAAQDELKAALAERDDIRTKIVEVVAQKPGYKTAVADKAKADADVLTAQRAVPPVPDNILKAANRRLDAATIISKMENDALSDDAGYTAAEERYRVAMVRIQELNGEFDMVSETDEEVVAADEMLADAKEKLDEANRILTEAHQKEAEAARARSNAMRNSQNNNNFNNNNQSSRRGR